MMVGTSFPYVRGYLHMAIVRAYLHMAIIRAYLHMAIIRAYPHMPCYESHPTPHRTCISSGSDPATIRGCHA